LKSIVFVLFEAQTGGTRMFTGQGASLARRRLLRFWSIALSAVLAITLLQVAPPAKAAPAPPACEPVSRIAFDGTSLNRIYDFTQAGTCTWTAPSGLGQATVLVVAGGDGGAEGVGGFGGEAKTYATSTSPGESVSITVGAGGIGETISSEAQPGENSSITIGADAILEAFASISTTPSSFPTLGTMREFGGTQAAGQTGPANFGSGGGAKSGDSILSGNGASGRVVVSYAIANSSFSRYKADDFVNGTEGVSGYWPDRSAPTDAMKRALVSGSPVKTTSSIGNGASEAGSFQVVQGTPNDSIVFPASAMPDNYTLFTVARYNEKDNGSYKRIFDGKSDGSGINWLSGFWGFPGIGNNSGVAFHGENGGSYKDGESLDENGQSLFAPGWLTPVSSIHRFDWVVSTDQNNLYRSNGATRSYGDFTGGIAPSQLTINGGDHTAQPGGEASDFQVADIIVFDHELSESEYQAVERYLSEEYGVCLGTCLPPVFDPATSLIVGDVNQPYSTTIVATSPDSHSLSFAVVDPLNSPLPQGLELDAEEGTITGVPELGGSYSFTIEVTDTVNGQSASQVFFIFVNDPPPPPNHQFSRPIHY
jgi:hypothetical protein